MRSILQGPGCTPPHDTLVEALERAAAAGAPFVTFHGADAPVPMDARATLSLANRARGALLRAGVERGDRVVLLLPTGEGLVAALLGTMLAGAVPVPLAVPMTFGSMDRYLENLATVVDDAEPRVLVATPRIAAALGSAPMRRATRLVADAELREGPVFDFRLPSLSGSDPAFIQYTSGTTGRPKGAVISHRAVVSNAFAIATALELSDGDVAVSWLPLFHDMGLVGVLLTALCHPYPIHLLSPQSFAMSPWRWMDVASRVGATLTAAPNFAYELCASRSDRVDAASLSTLRVALNGAEPVHPATVARFERAFAARGLRAPCVMPVYGMAEATLAVTFPSARRPYETLPVSRRALESGTATAPAEAADALDAVSVGRPVAGVQVRVKGARHADAPDGQVGEIHVAGPSLMSGYFRDDRASADAICGGWLRTGDLGFVDRGRVFVTGRAKDIIIQSGRNVYPYDVERVAVDAGALRPSSVVAFGRPNAAAGTEDVVVVAETTEKDDARRDQVAKAIRGQALAVLGVRIDEVHLWPTGAIPRTTSGKMRRRECARLLRERTA